MRTRRLWVAPVVLILAVTTAQAGAPETDSTWTLRQAKKSDDGWLYRKCSVLRFADEGERAVGTLVAGTVDGIVEPLIGGDEFIEAATGQPVVGGSPDMLADGSALRVTCTVERGEGQVPRSMTCEGGGSAVTFTVGRGATTRKFSGRYGGPEGGVFSMSARGSKCTATSEALLDGIPVLQRPERRYAPSRRETLALKTRFKMRVTLRDVLLTVGPGYRPWGSSTGSITWTFTAGPGIRTSGAPSSLNDPVYFDLR